MAVVHLLDHTGTGVGHHAIGRRLAGLAEVVTHGSGALIEDDLIDHAGLRGSGETSHNSSCQQRRGAAKKGRQRHRCVLPELTAIRVRPGANPLAPAAHLQSRRGAADRGGQCAGARCSRAPESAGHRR